MENSRCFKFTEYTLFKLIRKWLALILHDHWIIQVEKVKVTHHIWHCLPLSFNHSSTDFNCIKTGIVIKLHRKLTKAFFLGSKEVQTINREKRSIKLAKWCLADPFGFVLFLFGFFCFARSFFQFPSNTFFYMEMACTMESWIWAKFYVMFWRWVPLWRFIHSCSILDQTFCLRCLSSSTRFYLCGFISFVYLLKIIHFGISHDLYRSLFVYNMSRIPHSSGTHFFAVYFVLHRRFGNADPISSSPALISQFCYR